MRTTISEKEKLLYITFDRLKEKYPSGLYEWLYKNNLEVYRHIIELEDSINDNFSYNRSIQDLKALLREYWVEHMKAIREFKGCGQSDVSLDDVRSERIDTLETEHVL